MGCKMNYSSNIPILSKLPTKTPTTTLFSSSLTKPKFKPHSITSSSSSYNQNQQQQPPITSSTTTQIDQPQKTSPYHVEFKTLRDCKLGISRYPDFVYNAQGGQGNGIGSIIDSQGISKQISVSFDVQTLYIPPLNSATTRFLGLPLPPFLKIDITPELLRGTIDEETGKVDLEFKAKFWFSVGNVYKAPPLIVKTVLTSEEANGTFRRGRGERLDKEGKCRLVGVATVEPIDDIFMNSFLALPTECLADLYARISLSGS